MERVNLLDFDGFKFRINEDKILPLGEEIEEFIESEPSLKKVKFKTQIPKDIQSNNKIEGLDDDIEEIHRVIDRRPVYGFYEFFGAEKVNNRIINLYRAYKYIQDKKEINKENLRSVYWLISDGLISEGDQKCMGEYYREGGVCITNLPYYDERFEGLNYHKIDEYMNRLFDYINNTKALDYTDYFVISQIAHFYFVYIHPYFDCNGRTSRTVAMWYLLNNRANAFLNFNRSIPFTKGKYFNAIESTRKTSNLTHFLEYMLKIEKAQLEKEYIITSIEKSMGKKLSDDEYLLLEYFLSNNEINTLVSLQTKFNDINKHKFRIQEVRSKLEPLMEKGLLIQTGETKKTLSDGTKNPIIRLDGSKLDIEPTKIKRLKIENYISI